LLQPFQRAAHFSFGKTGAFQFVAQCVAVGLRSAVQIGVEVILEEIDQDIENAFLHFAALVSLEQVAPLPDVSKGP
jgi:hypothetical protein